MGCWNETCLLTRLPIREGDPVVALTALSGAYGDCRRDGFNDDLLFGVHLRGVYGGYGAMVKPERPELTEFCEEKFAANSHWRPLAGSQDGTCVSLNAGALFETGYRLAELLADYGFGGDTALLSARSMLDELIRLINERIFTSEDFQQKLPTCCAEVFGKELATSVRLLVQERLLARSWQPLIHTGAFDLLIAETGAWTPKREDRVEEPFRITAQRSLAEWLKRLADWQARETETIREFKAADKETDRLAAALEKLITCPLPSVRFIPLAAPFQTSSAPIYTHFWATAKPAEVVAAVGIETLIDQILFEYAMHGIRSEITRPPLGGQDGEMRRQLRLQQATLSSLGLLCE